MFICKHTYIGVFDGHGGDHASLFCEERMGEFIAECADPLNKDQLHAAVLKADADFIATEGAYRVYAEWRVHIRALVKRPRSVLLDAVHVGCMAGSCRMYIEHYVCTK